MFVATEDILELSGHCANILASQSIAQLKFASIDAIRDHIGGSAVCFMLDPMKFSTNESCEAIQDNDRDGIFKQSENARGLLFSMRAKYISSRCCQQSDRSDVFVWESDDASDFGRDGLRPLRAHRELIISIRSDQCILGLISIQRCRDDSPFSRTDLAKADFFAPFVRSTLNGIVNSDRIVEANRYIDALSRVTPFDGVLLLDDAFNIRYQGGRAAELLMLLRSADLSSSMSDREALPKALLEHCSNFITQKLECDTSRLSLQAGTTGHLIEMTVRRLSGMPGSPLILVGLSTEARIMPSNEILKQNGVTRRQIDILSDLCNGLTNQQIANKRFISAFTVQSHVRSIYENLGVHNRVGMMGVIAKMAR